MCCMENQISLLAEFSSLLEATRRSLEMGETDLFTNVYAPYWGVGGEFRDLENENSLAYNPIKGYPHGLFVHQSAHLEDFERFRGFQMGEIQAGGWGDDPLDAVDPLYVCETCGQAQRIPSHSVGSCKIGEITFTSGHSIKFEGFLHLILGFKNGGCQPEDTGLATSGYKTLHFYWSTAIISYFPVDSVALSIQTPFNRGVTPLETDFTYKSLAQENMEHAYLPRCDFSYADLSGVRLKGAFLQDSKFYKTNLSGANLYWANLHSADLTECNLSGADLRGANLKYTRLTGADLSRAITEGADFSNSIR